MDYSNDTLGQASNLDCNVYKNDMDPLRFAIKFYSWHWTIVRDNVIRDGEERKKRESEKEKLGDSIGSTHSNSLMERHFLFFQMRSQFTGQI